MGTRLWHRLRSLPRGTQAGIVIALVLAAALYPAAVLSRTKRTPDDPVVSTGPTATQNVLPSRTPTPTAGPTALAEGCRTGNPLANVYHPRRLRVLNRCMTVSGIVRRVMREPDGDIHFDLQLDSPYRKLLNRDNITKRHGWLVAETVSADEPGCIPGAPAKLPVGTYDYGLCTGANIVAPIVGLHVGVTGPYVLDRLHGWMEIHPVWRIDILAPA